MPALGSTVDAGDAHSCATRFGVLYCWGYNGNGRLGVGDMLDRARPARVGSEASWVAVATGVAHTCALKADGSVWCFGSNKNGQLARPDVTDALWPLSVSLPGPAVQLSSMSDHACAVLTTGELYCWGSNWEGSLGQGDTHPGTDYFEPVRVENLSDWTNVGTGQGHTCAVRGGGLLFGWGRNTAANLGLGSTTDQQRRSPTQIGPEEDWLSVVSGQDASCGLRSGGDLYCWGDNTFGTLGLGDRDQRLLPSQVAAAPVWTDVSLDTFHACGIDSDSNLYCWGRNAEGQLGTLDNDDRLSPTVVGSGFLQVVAGRMYTCATTTGGRFFCAGKGERHQLGLGDTRDRNAFTEVAFP